MALTNPHPDNPKLSELYRSYNRLNTIENILFVISGVSLLIAFSVNISAMIVFFIFLVISFIVHSSKMNIGKEIIYVQDALEAVKHEINKA
ncbi:MAG: hypothetical protein IJV35_08910 [Neisseriaceae bacterium]|nr:hypothetical protein [Neisseriaceae bacterium]